ncbi:MAG: ArsA-related P-loop ATPase [Actinomycetota bacterium]
MASTEMTATRHDARVVIVVGKGGVGSSTVAAAEALAAARRGADVLFVPVDGRPGMGTLLGGAPISDREQTVRRLRGGGRIRARTIPADQAFGDYLDLKGVGALLRRAASAASLPMIAAATPGLEHLLVLGKIKELDLDAAADMIVVDAPPAGHATPFLRSASGLSEVVSSGPVLEQADEVRAMLTDHTRCAAVIVALAEITPVSEAIELAGDLDELGIRRTLPVLNGCWPDRPGLERSPGMAARGRSPKLSSDAKAALTSSVEYGRRRLALQRTQLERITESLGEPVVIPRVPTARLGPDDLERVADALDPDSVATDVTADGERGERR